MGLWSGRCVFSRSNGCVDQVHREGFSYSWFTVLRIMTGSILVLEGANRFCDSMCPHRSDSQQAFVTLRTMHIVVLVFALLLAGLYLVYLLKPFLHVRLSHSSTACTRSACQLSACTTCACPHLYVIIVDVFVVRHRNWITSMLHSKHSRPQSLPCPAPCAGDIR